MERLKRAGVEPNEVDYVLTTHVHVDHVGWNTYLKDGVWLPTFPNARYIFSRDEHEFFTNPANFNDETRTSFAAQQDSVLPIMAAGLADPIGIDDTAPIPGFTFIATPGHSPFHASIMMESAGQKALFCGDIVHHPIQMHQPEWSAVFDSDPKTAVATRRRIMDLVADENIQLFTPHFTGTSTGWVTKDGANYTWRFAE